MLNVHQVLVTKAAINIQVTFTENYITAFQEIYQIYYQLRHTPTKATLTLQKAIHGSRKAMKNLTETYLLDASNNNNKFVKRSVAVASVTPGGHR